jgi:hypothetical protein
LLSELERIEEGVLLANPVGPTCSTEKFDNRLSMFKRLFDVSIMFDEFFELFELSTFEFFELSMMFDRLFDVSMLERLFDEFVDVISPESVELSSGEVVVDVVAVDETLKSAISCLFICSSRSM